MADETTSATTPTVTTEALIRATFPHLSDTQAALALETWDAFAPVFAAAGKIADENLRNASIRDAVQFRNHLVQRAAQG